MTQRVIQDFLNLPGIDGVAVMDGHSRPYFHGVDQNLNFQQREALAQGIQQVVKTIPPGFESFEFQFTDHQVHIYKLDQDSILLVLANQALESARYRQNINNFKALLQEDFATTISAFRSMAAQSTAMDVGRASASASTRLGSQSSQSSPSQASSQASPSNVIPLVPKSAEARGSSAEMVPTVVLRSLSSPHLVQATANGAAARGVAAAPHQGDRPERPTLSFAESVGGNGAGESDVGESGAGEAGTGAQGVREPGAGGNPTGDKSADRGNRGPSLDPVAIAPSVASQGPGTNAKATTALPLIHPTMTAASAARRSQPQPSSPQPPRVTVAAAPGAATPTAVVPLSPDPVADYAAGCSLRDALEALNQLSEFTAQYLGTAVIVNYWRASKPNYPWIQPLQIDRRARFNLEPMDSDALQQLLTPEQQQQLRAWVITFSDRCTKVIRDFWELLARQPFSPRQRALLLGDRKNS